MRRPSPKRTHLDRVLVGEKVNDLKRVCDDADGQELLAVVATFHHKTGSQGKRLRSFLSAPMMAYLSTRRSTMGIWAFLNCFFA